MKFKVNTFERFSHATRIKKTVVFATFLILDFAFSSCNHRQASNVAESGQLKDHLENVNRIMIQRESAVIDSFVFLHKFKMTRTGTGLRYEVYDAGKGNMPSGRDNVSISYKMATLDGEILYEADSLHPLAFRLGEGRQPAGLEEGICLMQKGAKARLVVPSHLAYGTAGDGQKVTGATPLYYDLQLIKITHE